MTRMTWMSTMTGMTGIARVTGMTVIAKVTRMTRMTEFQSPLSCRNAPFSLFFPEANVLCKIE